MNNTDTNPRCRTRALLTATILITLFLALALAPGPTPAIVGGGVSAAKLATILTWVKKIHGIGEGIRGLNEDMLDNGIAILDEGRRLNQLVGWIDGTPSLAGKLRLILGTRYAYKAGIRLPYYSQRAMYQLMKGEPPDAVLSLKVVYEGMRAAERNTEEIWDGADTPEGEQALEKRQNQLRKGVRQQQARRRVLTQQILSPKHNPSKTHADQGSEIQANQARIEELAEKVDSSPDLKTSLDLNTLAQLDANRILNRLLELEATTLDANESEEEQRRYLRRLGGNMQYVPDSQ